MEPAIAIPKPAWPDWLEINQARTNLAVLAGFALVTLLFFWRLVASFTTVIPGDNGDAYANLWSFWYLPFALTHHLSPWASTYQLAPYGVDLIYHTNCYLPVLLTWPINAILGIAAAYNTAVLLAVSLGAFAFYLFCRETGASAPAAVLGGFAFAFSPFTFAHLPGHISLLQTHFIAFALLFLARILKAQRLQILNSVLLGVSVWSVAVTDLTLLVMFVCLAFVAIIAGFVEIDIAWKNVVKNGAIAVAVCGLLTLPWAYAIVSAMRDHDYSKALRPSEGRFYCSLADLFVPPNFHGLWGRRLHPGAPPNPQLYSEAGGYIGMICLVLAGFAVWLRGTRTVWAWTCAALLFASFSVGMSFAGKTISLWSIVLPANFSAGIPLVNQVRVPARFSLGMHMCLAVVCAHGFDGLVSLVRHSNRVVLIWAGAFVLLVLDFYFVPIPVATTQPSERYRQAKLEGDGAILELPLWIRSGPGPMLPPFAPKQLLDQTYHQKPILSTYVSRIPNDVVGKVFSNPVVQHLGSVQRGRVTKGGPDTTQTQAFLKRANVRWIVVPPDMRRNRPLMAFLEKAVPLSKPKRIADSDLYEIK